jgi:serine/threonine-protein phosphatase 5
MTSWKLLQVTEFDKEKAEELKDLANKFYAENNLEAAVNYYTEAISYNPYVASYYTNRSIANFKLELFGSALSDADEALKVDGKFIKAYYRRACANMVLGHLKGILFNLY